MDKQTLVDKKRVLDRILEYDRLKFGKNLIESTVTVPEELEQEHFDWSGDRGKEWFKDIRISKFKYLCLRSRHGSEAKKKFLEIKKDEPALWKEYIEFWDDLRDFEEIAYISRLTQHHGDLSLVHLRWYNDSKEFQEWARICRDKLNNCRKQFEEPKEFKKKFQELHEQIMTRSPNIYEQESYSWIQNALISVLLYKTELICEYFSENTKFRELLSKRKETEDQVLSWILDLFEFYIKGEPLSCANENLGYIMSESVVSLLSNLAKKVSAEQLGKEETILLFLRIIKDSEDFRCDICDFLEVTGVNGQRQLNLLTSTVKDLKVRGKDREHMKELKENESYREGAGISGSILIKPSSDGFFHAGSNFLKKDYRQSEKQKSFYEKAYYKDHLKAGKGELRNFWIFPICHDNGEVQYALRVVNRADPANPEKLHGRAWDFPTRFRLSFLVKQFGDILKYVSIGLAEELKNSLDIDWIEEKNLRELLSHLQRVASRRIENRYLGCTIMVVSEESESDTAKIVGRDGHLDFPSYTELENMFDYYDALDSDRLCVILDENLQVFRTKSFKDKLDMITELNQFTNHHKDSIVLRVEEGHRVIKISKEGDFRGEIYFSEARGDWVFRPYDEILNDICSNIERGRSEISRGLVQRLLNLTYCLSACGYGALIVVGRESSKGWDRTQINLEERITLDELNADMKSLVYLAKLDGAVIIGSDGIIKKTCVKITNNKRTIKIIKKEHPDTSIRRKIYDISGSRHKTGILTSIEYPRSLVLIVSQNRTITALSSAQTVDGRSYYFRRF